MYMYVCGGVYMRVCSPAPDCDERRASESREDSRHQSDEQQQPQLLCERRRVVVDRDRVDDPVNTNKHTVNGRGVNERCVDG